jgi:ferrous iron transport protein B
MAPALAPLGFGTWEAASSLITGVIAKEIVVGTMAEIYARKAEKAQPAPTLAEDLKEIGASFAGAVKESAGNVVSTIGLSSMSFAEKEDAQGETPLKAAVRSAFTPLTAFGFMVFVLLYMPCVVVAIAMRQEFGGWKWFGVAFAYQTALAWGMALLVHQGGRFLGLGG